MSTAEIEVFEAFTSIGIASDKALAAAAALNRRDAGLDVGTLRADVTGLKSDMSAVKSDIATIKPVLAGLTVEVAVLKWMCGAIIALVIAILLKLFVR